jgi:hypothetical protein
VHVLLHNTEMIARRLLSLIVLLAARAVVSSPSEEDCSGSNVGIVLDMKLDSVPEEIGYSLRCSTLDKSSNSTKTAKIWDVPPGVFNSSSSGQWFRAFACVHPTLTQQCVFTVKDSGGDGLQGDGTDSNSTGWFSLFYDSETIVVYPSSFAQQDHVPFTERSYCFGPTCKQANFVQDRTGGVQCTSDQDEVSFRINFDYYPEEVGWVLECEDQDAAIWGVEPGFDPIMDGNNTYERGELSWATQTACLSKDVERCTMKIYDETGDGLGNEGWFMLTVGANTIAVFDATNNETSDFESLSYCIGSLCNPSTAESQSSGGIFVEGSEECKSTEQHVSFRVKLDSYADETGWILSCKNEGTIWNAPPGTFDMDYENGMVTYMACVPLASPKCVFTMFDEVGDGLVEQGDFNLTVNGSTLFSYDKKPFFNQTFCFGAQCGSRDVSSGASPSQAVDERSSESSGGLSSAAVAGIAVPLALIVLFAGAVAVVLYRRRREAIRLRNRIHETGVLSSKSQKSSVTLNHKEAIVEPRDFDTVTVESDLSLPSVEVSGRYVT